MNLFSNRQRKVGILRGGHGPWHDRSIEEGANMLVYVVENLFPKWKPVDIYIDRTGVWHMAGREILPTDLMQKVDVVWNTSLPEYTQILEQLAIPVVSHSAFTNLLKNNPEVLAEYANKNNIKTPRKIVFPVYQADFDGNQDEYILKKAKDVWQKFSPPWVVRAYNTDHNVAVRLAKTFPMLVDAISEMVSHGDSILVEELIPGKVATTHVVPGFRGEDLYHFPVFSPYKILEEEKAEIRKITENIYRHFGGHYLKIDFVIHARTGVHLVDFNLKPDIRENSHFESACLGVGARTSHVISHILDRYI